jgi:hypothetical protein
LLQSGVNIDQLNPSYYPMGVSALSQSVANPLYGNGGVGTLATAKVTQAQLLLPFPQYTSISVSNASRAAALYYSLYFRAERRFSNGLSILASYTWSRSKDDITGASSAGASNIVQVAGPQNAYNLAGEWSLSTQNVPDRFTMSATYELPFGKGKKYLTGNNWLNYAVGGWSLNTFGIIQSGFPLQVTQSNSNSLIGASYQRPNATGAVSAATSGSTDSRLGEWLNPAAFSVAPELTFGDTSRFLNVGGPGLFSIDFSVFKSFTIRERIKAQFRAEALNSTNTPYFGNPGTTVTSASTFGVITSQINYPRLVQLGLRFSF